jgi:hypothetical protein
LLKIGVKNFKNTHAIQDDCLRNNGMVEYWINGRDIFLFKAQHSILPQFQHSRLLNPLQLTKNPYSFFNEFGFRNFYPDALVDIIIADGPGGGLPGCLGQKAFFSFIRR